MPVTLLFGVHAHQPVGNFPDVMETAHARCYRPFLQTLYRFPAFRFSAHFSGWLLDYLLQRHPADMALLGEMVDRGQVELFGSGWAEPILAAVPGRDRILQLDTAAAQLERHFGARPRGAWLTERVWESNVVPALAATGVRYVTVDDYHFLCTGRQSAELDGYYTTEEDGSVVDVFPISELLRYRLPFSPAPESLATIERMDEAGASAAIYFDDIEKFGIWPETWEWVYGKQWLEQFLSAVLASPRIRTATYAEFHAARQTRGVIYLPTTSYLEMNEWTLPMPAAERYAALVREHKNAGRFDQTKAFLRGGIWRNFLSRYAEANWMHKRMLALSARFARLSAERRTAAITENLLCAQANDAYWHGLFGGLYLPHLRRAVYCNLIELESVLDRFDARPACERIDLDYDGKDEIFLHNDELQLVLRDDGLGAAHEFDSYRLAHNFADTLRRRREHYYAKIERRESQSETGEGIASAHDRISYRDEIREEDLLPDSFPRVSFHDRFMLPDGTIKWIDEYACREIAGEEPAIEFQTELGGGVVSKRYTLAGSRLGVAYTFEGAIAAGSFATELNLSLPSCDGAGGRYVLADGTVAGGFGQALARDGLVAITLDDRELGGRLTLTASAPVDLRTAPHQTVSQSDAGFEKIMQAATLRLSWPVNAGGGGRLFTLHVAVA